MPLTEAASLLSTLWPDSIPCMDISILHIQSFFLHFLAYCEAKNTPKTRFSESRFSEILNLMNKLQLPFSYFSLYPDSN